MRFPYLVEHLSFLWSCGIGMEEPNAVTNISSVPQPKILVTASGSFFHQHHITKQKIDNPPNLKKDRCYTKFGGIDRITST
jgi:hypothetical protein